MKPKDKSKTVVVLSGGLDSTVLLHYLAQAGGDVLGLSMVYGQRHQKEVQHASEACARLGVPHDIVDVTCLRAALGGSALTEDAVDVPHGHYEDASMKATVVPNRNMILLSIAAGYAIARRSDTIAYGAHSGDHAIYPDCRPEFADAMQVALALCHFYPVTLYTPFIGKRKADIVALGHDLHVPMEDTWSCYEGGAIHCGKCGTCVERIEAFTLANVKDLTPYQGAVT